MKKILLFIGVPLLVFFISIYILIPNRINYSKKISIAANHTALMRKLVDMKNWHNWWVTDTNSAKEKFLINGFEYRIADIKTLSLPLTISNKSLTSFGEFTFLSNNIDSTDLNFDGTILTSYNPIKRIQLFFAANKIKKGIASILQSISSYYSTAEHLYGYDIQRKSVVDSILIFTFKESKGYPSTEVIYSLVDELRSHIKNEAATETGFPMLNIFKIDSVNYRIKVAIPVNKKLPSSGNISYKEMLGGGNILTTEVHGGNIEIQKAFNQVQNYVSDFKRVAPAISFQSLVTDRRKEPDSSKWITRIYYPVM